MESVLRPLIVIGGSVVITLLVGWLVDLLLRQADSRHHETPLWGLLRRCRPPLQVVVITALLRGSYRATKIDWVRDHRDGIGQVLTLVLIGASAWLVVRIAATVVEASYSRYATATRDPARVRRVRTQVTLIQRVVIAVVTVVAIAAMLLTFPRCGRSVHRCWPRPVCSASSRVSPPSRRWAISSPGCRSRSATWCGSATPWWWTASGARSTRSLLTFLAVRTWDERRITMPVSYFTSQPFENWSRGGVQMTGTVYFHLDHSAPIAAMREKLREILGDIAAWDGRDWSLAVTDTTPTTIEVRAVVTAKDADDIWTARCAVREQLIGWLRDHHPYALPRVATAPAALPPGEQWAELTGAKAGRAGRAGHNGSAPPADRDDSKAPRTGRG